MKRGSILTLFIFLAFIVISSSAMTQDSDSDQSSATDHNVIMEDTATEHADKVYDNENVKALKSKPVTYTDGYHTYINDKVSIKLDDYDNIMTDSVFYRINEGSEVKYSGPFNMTEEGAHTIYYYGIDKMGNKEGIKTLNVILDLTPPEVTLTIIAPFAANGTQIYASDNFTYNYTISARDNLSGVASVTYAANGEEHKPYFRPFTINSSKPVDMEIIAVDKVGNSTTKYYTRILDDTGQVIADNVSDVKIIIDNTPPTVKILSDRDFFMKDDLKVASKDYKYSITAEDQESGVKGIYYRLDNSGDFVLYTGEIQFFTNGVHKIEAIAKDGVGNTSRIETLEFYVDVVASETILNLVNE
ncbi:MAG: hypothetical protein FWG49_02010 [Leptospirales bacterium]|nr:hypothetical protein [Leptospirales bacterium]